MIINNYNYILNRLRNIVKNFKQFNKSVFTLTLKNILLEQIHRLSKTDKENLFRYIHFKWIFQLNMLVSYRLFFIIISLHYFQCYGAYFSNIEGISNFFKLNYCFRKTENYELKM
jgi:hypothetical protein